MKLLFKAIMLFFIVNVSAQAKEEIYQFSKDIEAKTDKDTLPWKYQMAATAYSISGFYKKALEAWDKNGASPVKISKEDSLYFGYFEQDDARDYIINRSKKERIIIINEAHHNIKHRVFTTSLLHGLYDNGYRFFGLEALSDTLINKRKFPVMDSGYYTQEPQMANLLKEAIDIGFTLFEYEPADVASGKEREIGQADNIARWMQKNPDAKFLIHCGWDHVIEGTPGNKSWGKAMAGRLKEKTRVDPFTIDQTALSEKGDRQFSSPYIAMAGSKTPVIMVDANGRLFNGPAANDQTDCKIIHPVTGFVNSRPEWLLMDGKRKTYQIPKSKIKEYPVLVLAYRKNEFSQHGVPADVVEVLHADDKTSLVLAKGIYDIIVKNNRYEVIEKFEIKIK
ncbi:hypothetical protein [Flavobacterium pallidum]|uniref:Polysaccharide deacetylase n=1 Tax=Flavobacterium pallidum TaxID=2172098 RepID=A0A2S1SFD7_9FLAO|nr:hypothetical protein [Flavobacterium pallidum]AWI25126.1 hypothetical protein HYN49_04025 [Flavobacterium pallidum]